MMRNKWAVIAIIIMILFAIILGITFLPISYTITALIAFFIGLWVSSILKTNDDVYKNNYN